MIAVLDFGGQYAHLIANRIRRLGVYSQIKSPDASTAELRGAKGIILSGGPASVYDPDQPSYNPELFDLGVPILGLCYGHQLMCQHFGGRVVRGTTKEYGLAHLHIQSHRDLFRGLAAQEEVWMSHGDTVERLPDGFEPLGATPDCPFAAVADPQRQLFGLQFHPEVTHTPHGMKILENFAELCGCARNWTMAGFVDTALSDIRQTVGDRKVFLLVSGGVDSTVVFALLNRALGAERVFGLHIDNGLMRKQESRLVERALKDLGFCNFQVVDASGVFLQALSDVVDPEEKRRVIGEQFVEVERRTAKRLDLDPDEWMLGQGTIYPDTIETGGTAHAAVIKTHHNRVASIRKLLEAGRIIEPLAQLYKDEVREVGLALGLPESLVWRYPFPGPGLAIRALCSNGQVHLGVSPGDCNLLAEMAEPHGLEASVWPVRTVGVQGDARTYAHAAMLSGRADWDVLEGLSTRITNQFSQINRVVYLVRPQRIGALTLKASHLTPARLDLLREADAVAAHALDEYGLTGQIWQMPVLLVPLSCDGKGEVVVLRPVVSAEAMTARFARMPMDMVADLAGRILALEGVDGVFYDVTHKPPGAIEWE